MVLYRCGEPATTVARSLGPMSQGSRWFWAFVVWYPSLVLAKKPSKHNRMSKIPKLAQGTTCRLPGGAVDEKLELFGSQVVLILTCRPPIGFHSLMMFIAE